MPTPDPAPRSAVVVGAGLAGAQTVSALRARGFDGRLTVLGDEGLLPYDRPPLSKQLLTRTEPTWLSHDLGIDLEALADEVRLDDAAVGLDPAGTAARTASGDVLAADAVVLACGSRPILPPGWQADVLHTAADADRLRTDLAPGRRLVIVGAGWIGAEIAGVAACAGGDVVVVEAGPAPLARQLGPAVGSRLVPWYDAAGVRLRVDAPATTVRRDGVTLASGEHHVGARPASDWLRRSLPAEAFDPRGGLVTDSAGRVPHTPGLWAVGDVATRPHPVFGTVPGGHWSAALHDPDSLAAALLGQEQPPAHAPYVFSQQLDHDLALFGQPTHGPVVWRGTPGDGPWGALYPGDDGTVRAVLLVDSPRDVGAVRKAMNRGAVHLDLERAADPTVRLRDVLAGR